MREGERSSPAPATALQLPDALHVSATALHLHEDKKVLIKRHKRS